MELKTTKDNILKKIEDLNKLIQQTAEVSRNEINLREQRIKNENNKFIDQLYAEISSVNTKVDSLENKIKDLSTN